MDVGKRSVTVGNIINRVKARTQGGVFPPNQEVTMNADGSGGPVSPNKGWKDWGHGILDVAGLIPGIGNVADLANAAWYGLEGDKVSAGLSLAAAIPGAGLAAGGVKLANKARKGYNKIKLANKIEQKLAGRTALESSNALNLAAKLTEKGGKEILNAPLEGAKSIMNTVGAQIKQPLKRITPLTKKEKLIEYGSIPVGAGAALLSDDSPNKQRAGGLKQNNRFIGGVASSGRSNSKSFNKPPFNGKY